MIIPNRLLESMTNYLEEGHFAGRFLKSMAKLAAPVAPMLLYTLAVNYLHEYSHASALRLLYTNARPKVVVWLRRGYCEPGFESAPRLSAIGKCIGERAAYGTVCAAGSLVENSTAVALVVFSNYSSTVATIILPSVATSAFYAFESGSDHQTDYEKVAECSVIAANLLRAATVSMAVAVAYTAFFID